MEKLRRNLVLLTAAVLLALPATAEPAADPTADSALANSDLFTEWSRAWEALGGDRQVRVFLASSDRGLATETVDAHGFVELDLIGGKVLVELSGIDRKVDVWALDNIPGVGRNILPESGDRLVHLARLAPGEGIVRAEKDLGAEAFRGFELNFVFVSNAGADPGEHRLMSGTRPYMEVLYTKRRLAREGFVLPESVFTTRHRALDSKAASPTPAPAPSPIIAREPHEILVKKGLVSRLTFAGADVFFREQFEGNGRTCGTCHPAENNQVIDVPFIASLPNNDPLFIAEIREAIDPNDPISDLERPPLMRYFGLILENVDDLSDPNNRFVMRGVPHSLSMRTSITAPQPNNTPFEDRTGWSGDGAPSPGTLLDFTFGAVVQHFPKNSLDRVFKDEVPAGYPFDFRRPTQAELEASEEFMRNAGRIEDITIAGIMPSDTFAAEGLDIFQDVSCNGCHFNASANTGGGTNNNFPTNVERLVNPAQGFQGITFPGDGGFLGQGETDPSADCDGDGKLDCFGDFTFNTSPLVEAADTPPFFHNNVVQTIEGAVEFYDNPPFDIENFQPGEADRIAAFLRVLNAAFNIDISLQRDRAALVIDPSFATAASINDYRGILGTSNKLLQLSNAEIGDAIEVLTGSPLGTLNPTAVTHLKAAHDLNKKAIHSTNVTTRAGLINDAIYRLNAAKADLGTGFNFVMGEGNLLF